MNNRRIVFPATLLATFFFYQILFYKPLFHAQHEPFQMNGQLSSAAKDIFIRLGQPEIKTLVDANSFAQANFIRKGERWEQQEETPTRRTMKEKETKLFADLEKLGMINEVSPSKKHFVYIGLMGGLKERVEIRLKYLEELVKRGLTFNRLVLLGGMRELQDIEKVGLPEEIKQELEMMRYVVDNSSLKNSEIIEVNTPMEQKPDGTQVRPNTDDTIKYFAQIAPQPGAFLVISNNPYTQRQTKVTKRLLDQEQFPTQGAGPALDAEERDIVMIMDEFARTLYEETKAIS